VIGGEGSRHRPVEAGCASVLRNMLHERSVAGRRNDGLPNAAILNADLPLDQTVALRFCRLTTDRSVITHHPAGAILATDQIKSLENYFASNLANQG